MWSGMHHEVFRANQGEQGGHEAEAALSPRPVPVSTEVPHCGKREFQVCNLEHAALRNAHEGSSFYLSIIADWTTSRSEKSDIGGPSFVTLLWPLDRCSGLFPMVLGDDVTLLDSPGLDVDSNCDAWLDQECADADLLVWVVNGESTITNKERGFFRNIAERLAKPDIVVLVNRQDKCQGWNASRDCLWSSFSRWDCASEEEEYLIHAAQAQHVDRITHFLHSVLKLARSVEEARERIFFVSAKEVLSSANSVGSTNISSSRESVVHNRLVEERRSDWER